MVADGHLSQGALHRPDQPWAEAQLARLYDAFTFEADIPLYLDVARGQGPRVLEVACGTGRVLLPLAEAGLEVVGVDASPHMLALARARLDEARLTAELIQQDMRALHLARRDFDLAILAVKSFVYLTERADQQRCLDAIHAHLRPGGLLAIDLLHPYPEWVTEPIGILRQDLTETDSNSGITVSRVEAVVSCDLSRQVRVIRSTYELVDSHGTVVEKRFVEWPYRWTYRFEAELLLEKAGFTVEAVYGGYRREPFTSESRAMVFLARKPSP